MGRRQRKIDTGNIGHKTQKEDTDLTKKGRHGNIGHKTQEEDTHPTKKIDRGNIGHKTQKDRHRYH